MVGEVSETFDKHGRVYEVNSTKYRSVTSILKTIEKMPWMKRAAEKHNERNPDYPWKQYTNDAMHVGTMLHYRIGKELALENSLPIPEFESSRPIPFRSYINNKGEKHERREGFQVMLSYWEDFKEIAKPVIVGTGLERFVWHSTGFAGRVDSVMTFDNLSVNKALAITPNIQLLRPMDEHATERWIVDFKSSKAIYETYPAQVWAYKLAWDERFPDLKADRMGVLRMNGETGWQFVEIGTEGAVMWRRAMKTAKQEGIL